MSPGLRRPLLATAACAAAALLLAGCSMARVLYGQADWLLLREMDDYMELREEQREWVAVALEMHLARHRVEELPGYAAALESAAARARRGVTRDDARWLLETGGDLLSTTVDGTLPILASTLATLDAEQRGYLAERLRERNRDFRRRHRLDASPEARMELRAQRAVEQVERWTGPLEPEQVELVGQLRNQMPEGAGAWLAYTEDRQRALLALLESGADAARIEGFLRRWARFEDMPESLRELRERQRDALVAMIVAITAALDSQQRAHLVDRLSDLAEDARALARST